MLRVLVVDDHPSFRRGVKEVLLEGFGSLKLEEAGDTCEMLELVRRKKWDLVIMDISMPGRSGPEALRELKGISPTLPVLVMTMHPEEQYAVRMLRAGADGYLTKASTPAEVVRAVKKVSGAGNTSVPRSGRGWRSRSKTASSKRRTSASRIGNIRSCA